MTFTMKEQIESMNQSNAIHFKTEQEAEQYGIKLKVLAHDQHQASIQTPEGNYRLGTFADPAEAEQAACRVLELAMTAGGCLKSSSNVGEKNAYEVALFR